MTFCDCTEYYCQRYQPIYKGCKNKCFINRTAFVDEKFGCDKKARLEQLCRPFQTITAAIQSIQRKAPQRDQSHIWTIVIHPGTYDESVVLPAFINLQGQNQFATKIAALAIIQNGGNTVSNLNIHGTQFPIVNIKLDSEGENSPVILKNLIVDLKAVAHEPAPDVRNALLLGQATGINGVVQILDSNIFADFTGLPEGLNQFLSVSGLQVLFDNVQQLLLSAPDSENKIVATDSATVKIRGGDNTLIFVNAAHTRPSTLFSSTNGSSIDIANNFTIAFQTPLSSANREDLLTLIAEKKKETQSSSTIGRSSIRSYQQDSSRNGFEESDELDITYAFTDSFGNIFVRDSAIDLSSFDLTNRVLANATNTFDTISLLDIKTRMTFVPAIKGAIEQIKYFATSKDGNVVASGGLYTNIVTVNQASVGSDQYFIQDNDSTVLISDDPVTVLLEDPAVVNEQVLYKGKQVTVKNITESATVSVLGKIFDGELQLLVPGQAITFQNDGQQWYIIANNFTL